MQKLERAVERLSLAIAMSNNRALHTEMEDVLRQLGEKKFWSLGYRKGILDRMLELKVIMENMNEVIKRIFAEHDVEFFFYNGLDFRNMEPERGLQWTQLPFARTRVFVVVGEEKNMDKLDIFLSYYKKCTIHLGHEPLDEKEAVELMRDMMEELEELSAEVEGVEA